MEDLRCPGQAAKLQERYTARHLVLYLGSFDLWRLEEKVRPHTEDEDSSVEGLAVSLRSEERQLLLQGESFSADLG
jgi:hypothetical protein